MCQCTDITFVKVNRSPNKREPGVYRDGILIGHLIEGTAFFPSKVMLLSGITSPDFTCSRESKPAIRAKLIAWIKDQIT